MQVSSAEQEVSCSSSSNPQNHYEMLRELLTGPNLTDSDRIRLLLLYALRYETDGRSQVKQLAHLRLLVQTSLLLVCSLIARRQYQPLSKLQEGLPYELLTKCECLPFSETDKCVAKIQGISQLDIN